MPGGVGGGCNSKHCWLVELLLNDCSHYFHVKLCGKIVKSSK